jgi:(R,R)-butanediol dehydrogenase/meso-butanediol dehydrogenase/diacetyl reductase
MKAAIWYGKGDIRIEDVPIPDIVPGHVRVKIKACGICGSDLHEYYSGPFLIPARPHPLTGRAGAPIILGHEFSGEVADVGQGVSRFAVGDKVTVNPLIYCGQCHYCRKGEHIMCTKLGTVGFAWDGAFAEYGVFPEYSVIKLPDPVTYDMGAAIEPLAVAIHAVYMSGMKIGDSVAIIGAGPIGLLVLQACKAAGAGHVYVFEPVRARLDAALKTGANAVFDPTAVDAGKAVGELTHGLRADIAFDCVGNQASFDTAVKVTGRRAIVCVVGLAQKPIQVPFFRFWGHEKQIRFSSGYQDEFSAAIAYLEDGRVKVNDLITGRIPLDNLVESGIKELKEHPDKHVKILVYP